MVFTYDGLGISGCQAKDEVTSINAAYLSLKGGLILYLIDAYGGRYPCAAWLNSAGY